MAWIELGPSARRRTGRRLRLLEELGRAVALIGDFPAMRAVVLRRFREALMADAALFCEPNPVSGGFLAIAADGVDVRDYGDIAISSDGLLVKWIKVNEEVLSLPDPRGAHEYLDPDDLSAFTRHSVRLCIPLLSVNHIMGLVLLLSRRPLRIDRDELRFLAACGRQAALAFEAAGRHGDALLRVRSREQAQRLAVAGQLAAAVAHEVRNPLTVIRSTVQLVMEAPAEWERKQTLLEGVIAEVDRISAIAGRLLDLSRPTPFEPRKIDLVALTEAALRLVRAHAESAAVTFRADLNVRPLNVSGDASELTGVIVNLLLNACQAMPTGGTVSVSSQRRGDRAADGTARPLAVIEIADEGPGMPPEVLRRAFDPFFTTRAAGTGLGLPTALGVIERHGGDLRLLSEPGRGTVAEIALALSD